MKNNHKIVVSVSIVILTIISMGSAMGLFDFAKVCLFSEVNAIVTLDGKPVEGVEVVRTAEWANKGNKIYSDKTSTDKEGRFHFDAMYSNSFSKLSLSTPVIAQKIYLIHGGKEYQGWKNGKLNYDENGELDNGQPIVLSCELLAEPTKKDTRTKGPVVGICNW